MRPIIAIYPGRFQPMGQHHRLTFEWMQKTFGADNSFIATSSKVAMPKSPLNFDEKLLVMGAHGISANYVIECRSPYQPAEVYQHLLQTRGMDMTSFSVVFIVGQKDMSENPRFKVGYTKKGRPTYYQDFASNKNNLQSADISGYLAVAPHVEFSLPNGQESSGTNLRSFLKSADPSGFEQAMGFYDERIDSLFKFKFESAPDQLDVMLKTLREMKQRNDLVLGTNDYDSYINELIDDIKHVKRSLRARTKSNKHYRKESARLQNAIESLRYLSRRNQRVMLDSNTIKEGINKSNDKLSRDEVKIFLRNFKIN